MLEIYCIIILNIKLQFLNIGNFNVLKTFFLKHITEIYLS